jgi:NitT/TauT family transport system substrate-binding protein
MRMTLTAIAARTLAAGSLLAGLASGLAPAVAQQKPWRHGIIEPKGDVGFAMMVAKGGFAGKHGLTIELPQFQNDAIALRALLAGDIESFEGGPGTAIVAASRGVDVKIVGCHWQSVVNSIFARGNIRTAQDLKGKTFAISAPGALPDLVVRAYLAQNRIPESDLKFASLGNDIERYKAMLAGVVAATVISIEFKPIAERDGFRLMARGSDVTPQFLRFCTMTTARVLMRRREDAVRFLAAEMQAFRHALDHREDEIRIAREVAGLKGDDPRPDTIFEVAIGPTGIDPTMPLPLDKIDWMQEQLLRAGNMTRRFESAKMVEADVRAQALSRAGLR